MVDSAKRPPSVALITGATAGIGAAVTRNLVAEGWRVLGVGRTANSTEKVGRRNGSGVPEETIRWIRADLSLLREVRDLTHVILTSEPRIDVLINNAGGIFSPRRETAEGIEQTWALNVLSPFLLTQLLLDRLRTSAPARVVNVASAAHYHGRLRFDDLERKHSYSALGAYDQSKLAIVMLTYEFARRFPDSSVSFNAVHPGFVASNFGRNNRGWLGKFFGIAEWVAGISPEEGARTPTYVATSSEVMNVNGAYFTHCRPIRSSHVSYNVAAAARLWEHCAQQTEI
jgi:retinol dehydrogenase 12